MENALESGSAGAPGANRQFVTFFVADLFLGVEVQKVQEVLLYQRMTPVPRAARTIKGLINLRGQIVTAIDLRQRLELSKRPADQTPMNVVIRTEDNAVSFLVDEIGDVLEMSKETFERVPETVHGVTRGLLRGVYKLQDQLLLVLDTEKTVNLDQVNG